MKNFKYIILSFLAIGFLACENETLDDLRNRGNTDTQPLPELTSGSADFSNYVAFGPSFTAGVSDGTLFLAAQEKSFPKIIADKFAIAGGGTFTQPLVNDNFGGLILGGNPVINPVTGDRLFTERLVFGGAGPVPLQSVNPMAMSTTDFALNNPTGPFNNLGIPGAKSFHFIAPGYGNIENFPVAANPYAIRVTGNSPNATILELATAIAEAKVRIRTLMVVLRHALRGGGIDFDDKKVGDIISSVGIVVASTEVAKLLAATLTDNDSDEEVDKKKEEA